MSEKMPEGIKAVIVNISIVAGLVLCYFRGYPPSCPSPSGQRPEVSQAQTKFNLRHYRVLVDGPVWRRYGPCTIWRG
jgi:hypothetical protein